MAALVAALFGVVEAGRGMGSNAADALFYLRFGVEFLPYMFIILGVATFVAVMTYTAALSRLRGRDLYVSSLGAFALVIVLEWAAIHLDLPLLYPVLWISVNIMSAVLGLQVWHVAGEVTDTRQAKRLNSFFISGAVLGGLLGNLATGVMAALLGTQNLLIVYAVLLLLSFLLTAAIASRFFAPLQKKVKRVGVWARLRQGFDYERGSHMFRLLSFASVVFSVLYFSISFPFSEVVSASFPHEADVASFLGLFSAGATVATLAVSLLFANRLYARIGIVNSLLMLPLMYLGGFLLWSSTFTLATAMVVRLAQMVVLGGLASPAWNSLFNVAPPERRAEVLGFDAAVPSQAGVVLSGLLLIFVDRGLGTTPIFTMGMVVALVCGYLVWQMRHAYGEALVLALRAGRFEVFAAGEGGLARFRSNASALKVAVNALHDSKPSTRRLAVEILSKMRADYAVADLIRTLQDSDVEVRLAALRALGTLRANGAVEAIASTLSDEPAVRACALQVLSQLDVKPAERLLANVERLTQDPDLGVRAPSMVLLSKLGQTPLALSKLNGDLAGKSDERVAAMTALGKIASQSPDAISQNHFDLSPVIQAASHPAVAVRRAACEALEFIGGPEAIRALGGCLNDPDSTVRKAAAKSLRALGGEASVRVMHILKEGQDRAQEAALDALIPDDPRLLEPLAQYAQREIAQALTWREFASSVPPAGRATKLVRELLETRAVQSELRLIKTVGILGNQEAMDLVAKSLGSRDPETRAEAVETLETLGNKQLAKAIIPLLEDALTTEDEPPGATCEEALAHLMTQKDAWARALAARSAAELGLGELKPNLQVLAASDHDPLARQAAQDALIRLDGSRDEVKQMETLQTVSSLERMILLREVPLFGELTPDDLKQIADIAREQLFPAGAVLFREGEEGDELCVLASGQVSVIRGSNGNEKVVAHRGAGEVLGEMAILDSDRRSATVRAEGDVRALVIDADAFKSILRDRPEVSLAVLRVLSRRLREMM